LLALECFLSSLLGWRTPNVFTKTGISGCEHLIYQLVPKKLVLSRASRWQKSLGELHREASKKDDGFVWFPDRGGEGKNCAGVVVKFLGMIFH